MNKFFTAVVLPAICCTATAAAQDTHLSLAQEVVDLLSQTEVCLSLCQDEQSVQEQLPMLQQLAEQARSIQKRQQSLPDTTLAEDIEIAEKCVPDFVQLQRAIEAHIVRLREANLITLELAEILGEAC